MVPKLGLGQVLLVLRFRAVLFRMVPKQLRLLPTRYYGFRAVLFRMVPKLVKRIREELMRF